MEIRAYTPGDREPCLAICKSLNNGTDAGAFAAFLEQGPTHFYVAGHEGAVIGCGGFSLHESGAELVWGMVDAPWRRQGLGRFLLFHRLREIGKLANQEFVRLRTPASEAAFFVKQGFRETSRDGQFVEMSKRLSVCA